MNGRPYPYLFPHTAGWLLLLWAVLGVACERPDPAPPAERVERDAPIQSALTEETEETEHTEPREEQKVAGRTRVQIGTPSQVYPLFPYTPLSDAPEHPRMTVHERNDGKLEVRLALAEDEAVWGLAQQAAAFNLRGHRIRGEAPSNDFPLPFFVASSGYGLFVNHIGLVEFDIGATESDELVITVPANRVELIFFEGSPREIVSHYTELVGRPRAAPQWMYRPWMSRETYWGQEEVNEMLQRMAELDLDIGAVTIDRWSTPFSPFRIDRTRYPRPVTWMRSLNEHGIHLFARLSPHFSPRQSIYQHPYDQDWLFRGPPDGDADLLDFDIPEARLWWRAQLQELAEMNFSGFVTETPAPPRSDFPDPPEKASGRQQHPYLYQHASFIASDAAGHPGFVLSREPHPLSAGLGALQTPRQHAEWTGLRNSLRAGLSAAFGGLPFWGHDIGGFYGIPDKELYIRWLQFGAFSPLMQFHGTTAREPWHYDQETVEIAQFYFTVRERLIPFLEPWGRAAREEGVPIIRPLPWCFPDDPQTHAIDTQYMLGPDLLVAPLVQPGKERTVYLPDGDWKELWTGAAYSGPRTIEHETRLHQIPLFVRAEAYDTYLPLLQGAPEEQRPTTRIEPDGVPNERGIVPSLRWLSYDQRTARIAYTITNLAEETTLLRVRLASRVGLQVVPDQLIRTVLEPGETKPFQFDIRLAPDLPPGTHSLQIEAMDDKGNLSVPAIRLVRPPKWSLLGPLDGGVGSAHNIAPANLDLDAEYRGIHDDPLRWRELPEAAIRDDGGIDLASAVGDEPHSTVYLHTTLHADQPRRVRFYAGSGDALAVWVNGENVFDLLMHRNPTRGEDLINGVLVNGENSILVRVSREYAPYRFYFRVD